MIFLNAFTAFISEIFCSTFSAWLMALLVFAFLLASLISVVGDYQ